MRLGKVIGEFNATPRVLPGIFGRRRSRGFHTFGERKPAVDLARMIGILPGASPSAMGTCEFLGRVVEHELGFRAQGLMIRSLALAECWLAGEIGKAVTRDLESRYRCEVSTLPDEEFRRLPGGVDGTSGEEWAQSLLANAAISGTSLSRAAWAATAVGFARSVGPAMPPPLLPIPRDQPASGEPVRHRQTPFPSWPVGLSMPTPLLPIPRDGPRARRRRRTWH